MPPIRRSASKIKSDSPVTKALSDSPIPTVEKSASPVPAPTRRPKVSRSRTAPTKSTKKKKPSRRTCVGCKAAVNDYLFLGWFSKVANDFKEKCLSCRRFDAVNDCLKSHADSDGNLTLEAQIEHIQDQEDQIKAWAVRMKKFAAISGDELMQAMFRLKAHPALQEGWKYFNELGAELEDGLVHLNQSSPDSGLVFGPLHSSSSPTTPPALSQRPQSLLIRLPYHQQAAALTSAALAIREWANLVARSGTLSLEQDHHFRRLDEQELEAVRALMRISYDDHRRQEV